MSSEKPTCGDCERLHWARVQGARRSDDRGEAMKPTPGPYTMSESLRGGTEVRGVNRVSIAWFSESTIAGRNGSYAIDQDEARANAEAWIAGIAAMEKLERIRDAYYVGAGNAEAALVGIRKILSEP